MADKPTLAKLNPKGQPLSLAQLIEFSKISDRDVQKAISKRSASRHAKSTPEIKQYLKAGNFRRSLPEVMSK